MAVGGRLFRPVAEGSLRDPVTNEQMNGNIMNPPRFAQFGGYSNADRGSTRNGFRIVTPGASTRREPVASG